MNGERGAFTVLIVLTESHQLAGLQIAGASATQATDTWRPPEYADPAAFTERDLNLGDEPLTVGATLSLPRQQTRVPAVVMLAGPGPQDRDQTLGPNKILKDIAWGLASRGIAVLRFVRHCRTELEGQMPTGAQLELLERLSRQRLKDLAPDDPNRGAHDNHASGEH